MPRAVRRGLLTALVFVVAGCGGSARIEDAQFGGMTQQEAIQEGLDSVSHELIATSSPIRGHHVKLLGAVPGKNERGDRVWVVHVRDTTEQDELCVRVWARTGILARMFNTEIDNCDLPGDGSMTTPSTGGAQS
jgi:hypothetical protein